MSDKSNQYFETQTRFDGELTDEVLVVRMNECNMVLKELVENVVWKIVINDAQALIKQLDDNWHDMMPDSKEFKEARVVKMACKHISELPKKYLQELTQLEEELTKRHAPQDMVSKDNDNS